MPYAGIFIGEQVSTLLRLGVNIRVIQFVPATPWPLPLLKRKWRAFSKIPKYYQWQGAEVLSLRYLAVPRNAGLHLAVGQMEKALQKYIYFSGSRPDLIHVHFAYPTGLAAVRCGAKLGVPTIVTVHGSDLHTIPEIKRKYYLGIAEALRKADQVLAISESMKFKATEICQAASVDVHRIGINLTNFKPRDPNSARIKLPELKGIRGPIVLYVGNLLLTKGVLDLVKAVHNIKSQTVHIVFLGDGPAAGEILSKSTALGLQNQVHLLGACPHHRVPYFINAADVFVLPSYKEGLGITCLEALACECPVVASNVGGIPEIIKHEDTGLLVSPGDYQSLSIALEQLLVKRTFAKLMAKRGRQLVERYYDIEKNTRDLLSTYQRSIKK